ncbi:MAG: crosslink repair DNA glycosylase YcaQ family protein [Anaerolineae bacterium]
MEELLLSEKRLTLTNGQARRFLLAHQGLWPPRALEGKAGVLAHIRHVGCIQFDPLNLVGRNPELVLQARVADFRPALLEDLLYGERRLLDGWDKMMSIYPLEDWPYFRRQRERVRNNSGKSAEAVEAVAPRVRQALRERGPLSSLDLDFGQTVDWSWAPARLARAALESMYGWGELIVHHKVNTRKVYDLADRHLAAELLSAPEPNETETEFHDWYVRRRLGSVGLLWARAGDAWLAMGGIKTRARRAALARLRQRGEVVAVGVEGIDPPLYLRVQDRPALERVLAGEDPPPQAAILAPLDNLLWDRRFIETLFGFRYRWEVYKPAAERQYGYYVLPILYGDRFVARFEPVRDKADGALVIQGWWWEPGVAPTEEMKAALARCFAHFMDYLGMDRLQIEDTVAEEIDLTWLAPKHNTKED